MTTAIIYAVVRRPAPDTVPRTTHKGKWVVDRRAGGWG